MLNYTTIQNIICEALSNEDWIEEKKMFRGICYMVNNKMCICVSKDHLMCRIGEAQVLVELEKDHCRPMIHNGRLMKDYVYVDNEMLQKPANVRYWVDLCLQFNPTAKSSKKK